MTAAVFPVAIAQTGRTVNETHATAVERSAVGFLQNAMTATSLPPGEGSPAVQSFADGDVTLQAAVRGNQIDTTDPRDAWVPLFRRDAGP